jgi:GNAT superfamily N-acetyltransferase
VVKYAGDKQCQAIDALSEWIKMGLFNCGRTNVTVVIDELGPGDLDSGLEDLADILQAAVNAGASVGFVQPFTMDQSRAFWRDSVFPSAKSGGRVFLVARTARRIVGTVQLITEMLPSQVHRCDVSKLLVHPDFRKRGIGKLLMLALEQKAMDLGKRLLTLDTKTGDPAEQIYSAMGYETAGSIPGYCRAPEGDRDDATTYMYKAL